MVVKKIYLVFFALAASLLSFAGCTQQPVVNLSRTEANAANSSPGEVIGASTPAPRNNDPESLARFLVAFDDGSKVQVDAADIRVKRTRYLLEELTTLTKEETFDISAATDAASKVIEDTYGHRISRQRLLEDMKTFYTGPKQKIKLKYSDALMAMAVLQYAN